MLPGVYRAKRKDGTLYYRGAVSYRGKRISLGSFPTEEGAYLACQEAGRLLSDGSLSPDEGYREESPLPFEKWVVLANFRDNGIYVKTPIYIKSRYFLYYFDRETVLKFDADDLFFYATHKIMRRGGHLFVADFGMQVNILSRYGVRSFGVPGRDYVFVNGDPYDFRYENVKLINRYHGVLREDDGGRPSFLAKIHVRGDYVIGRYATEEEAAVAYNKAAAALWEQGVGTRYALNYVAELTKEQYWEMYRSVKISRKITHLRAREDAGS